MKKPGKKNNQITGSTLGTGGSSGALAAPKPRRDSEIFWLRKPPSSSPPSHSPVSPADESVSPEHNHQFQFLNPNGHPHQTPRPPRTSSMIVTHGDGIPSSGALGSPSPRLPTPNMVTSPFSFPFHSSPAAFRLNDSDEYTETDVFHSLGDSTQYRSFDARHQVQTQQTPRQTSRQCKLQSPANLVKNQRSDSDGGASEKEVVSPQSARRLEVGQRPTVPRSTIFIPGSGTQAQSARSLPPPTPRSVSMPLPKLPEAPTPPDLRTRFDNIIRLDHRVIPSSSTIYEKSSPPSTRRNSSRRTSRASSPPLKPILQSLNISTFHEILFVGAVIMANFMSLAGLGQGIGPREYISATFHTTDPGEQAWFTASYSLTVGTFILIAGRLGDILGHKRMLAFGYFFLGVWSAFAGFSAFVGQQTYFDFCRAFQGISAAMLVPNALALLGRAYTPGLKKNIIFSLFGAMAPWGFVVGSAASNFFAQLTWWPWLFWSFGIASWALAGFTVLVIPHSIGYEAQFAGRIHKPRMDWMGSICGVSGLVLVNVAFNNAPLWGWGDPHVYFVLALGLFALVAFIWVEIHSPSPLVPASVMNRTVLWTLLLVGLGWASFGIWVYYTWRFVLDLRGFTPLAVSAQFSPALICGLLAAGATGFMITHTPVAFTMLVAMIAFFVGEIVSITMPVQQTYWLQLFIAIIILPFGMDMSFPAATILLSNHMPREHQGLAASLVNTVVNYSISLALGIAGSVEVGVNHGGFTPEDFQWGIQCAFYTSLGLSGLGVVLGLVFFARMLAKEGWRVMDH